jgi:hypothetical protein
VTSVQHIYALDADIALRARTAITTSDRITVSLAVVDHATRSVLHGAGALPSVGMTSPRSPDSSVVSLNTAASAVRSAIVGLAADLNLYDHPAVVVDVVTTSARQRCCELRFGVVLQESNSVSLPPNDSLRWLRIDSPAPFFTTDWAVLCAALQDLLANPSGSSPLIAEPHRTVS